MILIAHGTWWLMDTALGNGNVAPSMHKYLWKHTFLANSLQNLIVGEGGERPRAEEGWELTWAKCFLKT